jgi:hypothetical protein
MFCLCGCGLVTPTAKRDHHYRGMKKGDHFPFRHGHDNRSRKPQYVVDENTGCWNWQLGKTGRGYGSLNNVMAHRLYYRKHKGPIPEGLTIDHLCRNKVCVNPDHLEPVTLQENLRRRDVAMGRAA